MLADAGPTDVLVAAAAPPVLLDAWVVLGPPPPDDPLQASQSHGMVSKQKRCALTEWRYHGSTGYANRRNASAG